MFVEDSAADIAILMTRRESRCSLSLSDETRSRIDRRSRSCELTTCRSSAPPGTLRAHFTKSPTTILEERNQFYMATNEDEKQEVNKLSIEESREKRLARIKSKQRDRGGIFKPAESNPLIDILLARDASGRSPSKVRRKSLAHGPRKSLGRKNVDSDAPQPQMKRRKSNTPNTGAAASGARKGKRSLGAGDGAIEEEGPSHSSSKHCELCDCDLMRSYASAHA